MLAHNVSTQSIISPLSRIFNLGKVIFDVVFLLLTNMWRTLKILQSTVLLDTGLQARKVSIFQHHPIKP